MANYKLTIGAAGLSNIPAWLSPLSQYEWTELAGTSLSHQPGIDTGASSGKQDAWCGWGIVPDTSCVYTVGQGGHGDYSGNEIDKLDITVNVPAWVQIVASSSSSVVTEDDDYYSDGKPASVHGYHTTVYSPDLGKMLRFPGGSRATLGNPQQTITAFNVNAGTWDSAATWTGTEWYLPGSPSTLGSKNGAYAIHPTTGKVYCWFYNAKFCVWDPASPNGFTTLIAFPSGQAPASTAAAIDPTRETAFFLGGGSDDTMCSAYDISTNELRTITLTGTDIVSQATGCGMFYCAALDKFIVRLQETSGGGAIYAITPTTGSSWNCSLISTTGGGSIPATTSLGGADRPYTKFLYAPNLGVAIYGPRWSANVWALKLHEV